MTTSPKVLLVLGAIIANEAAFAQDLPPPPVPAPIYDPQQLPAYKGEVQQFTLTPRGDIDGMVLKDGTEVKTPPHLSTELAYSVHPGDKVTIHGLRAASLSLVQAIAVTNQASGQTVTDIGVTGKQGPIEELQGKVRMALHGARGEMNGVLLDDGTVLRIPPHEAYRFADIIKPGKSLFAKGNGLATIMGHVVEVDAIGPSKDQMSILDIPPGRAGKKPRP